ncbi:MAG: hypothetical protein ABIP12_01605 [Terriglobales bacterium]
MLSAIFVVCLAIISAILVLAGAAFYGGWQTQNQMDQRLDGLLERRRKARWRSPLTPAPGVRGPAKCLRLQGVWLVGEGGSNHSSLASSNT